MKHLLYELDEQGNRFHAYNTLWKRVGIELLSRHMTEMDGKTVLDYGCGRGETLRLFTAAGMAVTGADPDPVCVGLTSKYGPAVRLEGEDPVKQFGERSFDVVSCFHVLEHTAAPSRVLTGLGKVAREYVLLAVPNLRQLNRLWTRHIDLADTNEGHLQGWDHWHLLSLAERHCGLRLVEWGFDVTLLPFWSRALASVFGESAAARLETGLFRRMLPFHGMSVIGLFAPCASLPGQASQARIDSPAQSVR
jgi:SAM-dependent methyltransferase